MIADRNALLAAIDGTWPAARRWEEGPWTLREGKGGGQRVSAASAHGVIAPDDIAAAEAAMKDVGQKPLFMVLAEDRALDTMLAERGYAVKDPVNLWKAPIAALTNKAIPRVTAFAIWEPLAIMEDIWASAGIGPARLAVMHRAACKTSILARWNEKPAGVGFAAVHEGVCMVHAIEVLPHQRRQGVAGWIMRRAAFWAAEQGAQDIAVLCVKENEAANALYRSMGFERVEGYHYRTSPE
nr:MULTISPECIES: GNAT family N-acetyltransferase [unclassified Sulfitobacter]